MRGFWRGKESRDIIGIVGDRFAVIMAGGSGTRFWPLSRKDRPKQFLPLAGVQPLIRNTVDRLFPSFTADRILIVTAAQQAGEVRKAIEVLPPENILEEPLGRDTAPCVGLAATVLEWRAPGSSFCAMPSDHFIGDVAAFQRTLDRAFEAAATGSLVTFGMKPRAPATGFGYLERGDRLAEGLYRLKRFCEKPNETLAREFLVSGNHFWNSGIFVWQNRAILSEIGRHLPAHARGLAQIGRSLGTAAYPTVLRREYERFERISIDYGVMEKAENVVMIESGFEWDDIGSWAAVAARPQRDGRTRHVSIDSPGAYVFSSDPDHVVATIGFENVIVIHTPDATLVCARDRAEDVKKIVDRLKRDGLEKVL